MPAVAHRDRVGRRRLAKIRHGSCGAEIVAVEAATGRASRGGAATRFRRTGVVRSRGVAAGRFVGARRRRGHAASPRPVSSAPGVAVARRRRGPFRRRRRGPTPRAAAHFVATPRRRRDPSYQVGDWGIGSEKNEFRPGERAASEAVADSMAAYVAKAGASFVLALGDNFYQDGVANSADPLWDLAWRDLWLKRGGGALAHKPWYSAARIFRR